MFRKIVFAAFGAGLAVGLITALLQHYTTTPLILAAEVFESEDGHNHAAANPAASTSASDTTLAQRPAAHAGMGWAPDDGVQRVLFTSIATMLITVASALMLLSAMVIRGGTISGRTGIGWGIAGFAAISLAPAFGLPPELPGSASADLLDRQIWWLATAAVTAIGIGLMAFSASWRARVIAAVLIAAPHLAGAPHPPAFTSSVPAELAAQFVTASLGLAALSWTLIGWGAASLYERLEPTTAARA